MSDLTVNTVPLTTEDELFCQYPGREQQPCFLTLDLGTGELSAQYDPEVSDGARPESVWNGRIRWVPIPCLTGTAANRLFKQLEPLAQQILDGAEIDWDGNNHVGLLDESATEALSALTERCDPQNCTWPDGDIITVWAAADWFGAEGDAQTISRLGITADTTDEQISALAKVEQEEARSAATGGGLAILNDAEDYLRELRDELAAER